MLDGPARVPAAHQLVPDAPLVVVGHLDQLQPAHPVDPPGHVDGRGDRAAEPARPAAPVVVAGSGQCEAAGGSQGAQGPQASRNWNSSQTCRPIAVRLAERAAASSALTRARPSALATVNGIRCCSYMP